MGVLTMCDYYDTSETHITTDGYITHLAYPEHYPAIAPVEMFIGTHNREFLSASDLSKVLHCIHQSALFRERTIIDFALYINGAVGYRISRVEPLGVNSVVMYSRPYWR